MTRYHQFVRARLDIDEDVLAAAKELSVREKVSLGRVISSLARSTLQRRASEASNTRSGFPLLRGRRKLVTMEQIEKLLDKE